MRAKQHKSSQKSSQRPLDQRLTALRRANDIRTARVQLKKDLSASRVSITSVLIDPPDFVLTAKVFDLLLAVPRFGRVKSNRILQQARVSPSKTVSGLSDRQRTTLVRLLAEKVPPRNTRRSRRAATKESGEPLDLVVSKDAEPARFLLLELKRLLGDEAPEREALERAARIAVAEQSWRSGLGALLDARDVTKLLGSDSEALARQKEAGELIVLTADDGSERYPAFQFQNGHASGNLAQAHATLVHDGHVSPWTAASWARTSNPELDGLSPAQWTASRRDGTALQRVAERHASRLAQ